MIQAQIFQRLSDFPNDFYVEWFEKRHEPNKVLMCSPDYFDIVDVKNPFMECQSGKLNKALAFKQWEQLKSIYEDWKLKNVIADLLVIPGAEGREDMVFCANQSFPFLNHQNHRSVYLSKMRHESRQLEVPYFEEFYKQRAYHINYLKNTELFEGMGDTIPHPGRKLFYGGFGHRSNADAYQEIMEVRGCSIVLLELIHENFYHLDTCFVPLSDKAVMLCPDAFTNEGLQILRKCFEVIYEIPIEEALSTFCLNAHVLPDAKFAVIQVGSKFAMDALLSESYEVYETESSEFMKSGGSVFCMKMMMY
jgi:N-dimethylarginine dimethylaminohydrolase